MTVHIELRHGYTIHDVERIAQTAARVAVFASSDYSARYDEAWSGIVEHLYAAEEPPAEHDLFNAGRFAIWNELHAVLHYRGVLPADDGGYRIMAAYDRYWRHHARAVPSPENAVVERMSLEQILPHLSDAQRDALGAYASSGMSIAAAADVLGISVKAASSRLDAARKSFLTLWHEHEKPSRKWRRDCDTLDDERLVSCGTDSAYFRHRRRGEPICDPCSRAHAEYTAKTKLRRKRGLTDPNTQALCGTPGAYRRHKRRGEPIDDACMAARPRRQPTQVTVSMGYPRTSSDARAADRRARSVA